jgi:methylated-DNA-[protein]-cysteine S-methyltransferase
VVESPVGDLLLVGDRDHLRGLYLSPERWASKIAADWVRDDGAFADVTTQLREYFAGERTVFDVPLALHGTPFQQRVWEGLRTIPYGRTTSYGRLAAQVGRPGAARAVGLANGRNPVSIIVPCHRVIGSGGALTGYGGGLDRKRALLALEQRRATPALALDDDDVVTAGVRKP